MYDVSRKEKTDTYIHQQVLWKKSIPDGVGFPGQYWRMCSGGCKKDKRRV